jgi:hypothetical protein
MIDDQVFKYQLAKIKGQSRQFHQSERSNEILKTNKNLAEKLFDI